MIEQIMYLDDKEHELQKNKFGDYDNPKNGCPNCKRFRIMIGDDKKHRCEKCSFCIEDNEIDIEFRGYQNF